MLSKLLSRLFWKSRSITIDRLFMDQRSRCPVEQLFGNSYVEEAAVCHDLQVLTDTGWHDVTAIMRLAEHSTITITTCSGLSVEGADDHIVFDEHYNQIPLSAVKYGSLIQTVNGVEVVVEVIKGIEVKRLYDFSVESDHHRYFTNGILSHNSWIAGAFLLWFSIFNDDKHSLVVSNKEKNAKEMIHRVRYMYERLPNWIKPGVTADGWNKHSVAFENNSRIESQATTEDSGRGLSISLMFCLDGGNTVEVIS